MTDKVNPEQWFKLEPSSPGSCYQYIILCSPERGGHTWKN